MPATINQRVLEQSIPVCLQEADESDHPIPFLPSILFGDDGGRKWIHNAVLHNQCNQVVGTKVETFEVAKRYRGKTRTLHSLPVVETVEYHSLARHLGVRDGRLQNDVSFSFKPNLSQSSGMWNESKPRQRWLDYQAALQQRCLSQKYFQRADIKTFFNCIQHNNLREAIIERYEESFCHNLKSLYSLANRVTQLLGGWFADVGLPQGFSASFFFAEMPLLKLDYAVDNPNYQVCRYVDDFCLFGLKEAEVARQYEQLEAMIVELGLALNPDKSEFDTCDVLAKRLAYVDTIKQKYQKATAKYSYGDCLQKIDVAMQLLREEFADYDVDCNSVNYLLAIVRNNIEQDINIPDWMLSILSECFADHCLHAANALCLWRPIFNSSIQKGSIQELLGNIVFKEGNTLDTDLALCYGSFDLARQLHNPSLKKRLVERFEHDAGAYVSEWSGSVAARKGKALRAAQRHGAGNQLLMELFSKNNHYHEMRRYTAVAATSLNEEQRTEFLYAQRLTCTCSEELHVLECLKQYDEAEASGGNYSLAVHPDARRRRVKEYR